MNPTAVTFALALGAGVLSAAEQKIGYDDTPMIPGTPWHVHDGKRPQPRLVAPGREAGQPPTDAIVLFDGSDLSKWKKAGGGEPGWKVENGAIVIQKGGGDIQTREEFGDCQLHVEFAAPTPPKGDSQGRGNSGIFLLGLYEFQVLDSYQNPTYPDGQAASMYGQKPPLVNASRPPGEWQTYDIIFTAPRFDTDGKLVAPARLTALHNGVLVHNNDAYIGPSGHRNLPNYNATKTTRGPIRLQDHGDPVRYRNIWIRPLRADDGK